jgi:glutamyl/glutaminyl-tRNA synthetase
MVVSRFAPSTSGQAHPGTLLSALLVWLDARCQGGRALLRLEDLDHTRCRPQWADQLREALDWLELDWDEVIIQSARTAAHEQALDRLAELGRLYPCSCSRHDRAGGRRAPDGGWAYANTCRDAPLPAGGWRASTENIRVRIDDGIISLHDESGLDLSQDPAHDLGDPIVRRRDGVIAYHLAVVVDDHAAGVNRVVRGRDIAPSTATQVALQRLLSLPTPVYRHHFLLLEPAAAGASTKLAKLHGSIPFSQVRSRYRGNELRSLLALAAGIVPDPAPCSLGQLVRAFRWSAVRSSDRVMAWDGTELSLGV